MEGNSGTNMSCANRIPVKHSVLSTNIYFKKRYLSFSVCLEFVKQKLCGVCPWKLASGSRPVLSVHFSHTNLAANLVLVLKLNYMPMKIYKRSRHLIYWFIYRPLDQLTRIKGMIVQLVFQNVLKTPEQCIFYKLSIINIINKICIVHIASLN